MVANLENTINKFNDGSKSFSERVSSKMNPNPFKYIAISSSNFFLSFFSVVDTIRPEGFKVDYKEQIHKNVRKLKKTRVEKAYLILLMEYIAFCKHFMAPEFRSTFPIPFDDFIDEFKSAFKLTKSELVLMDQIDTKYDSAYNSRLLLSTMNFPKNIDDTFLIETIEEIKPLVFHLFNDNVVKMIRASKALDA